MKKFFITLFLVGATSALRAQGDRNMLQLRIDPAYFSPTGDGLQDQTFIYPVLKSQADIQTWQMDIISLKNHKRIERMSGPHCPALIKWDGRDKKNQPYPDGTYLAKFVVKGKHTKLAVDQPIYIDTKAPVVKMSISSGVFDRSMLESGGVKFSPRVFDDSPVDHWLLQVLDTTGHTVAVFWSSGPVHDVSWDGTDQKSRVLVPQGIYQAVFEAWDKAGNESRPFFSNLTVNVSAREMLEHALHLIQVNETPMGLIVPLRANDLFVATKNKLELSEGGEALLREVSILINAYPQSTVELDGYSRNQKKAAADLNKSSLYAWRVYSYLSKMGNVKASRLTVRGCGRIPSADRREVTVPVLKNGVEVIVEGNGPW